MDEFIGVSAWTGRLRAAILQVARHSCNVLIVGPSGTGKELLARAIHAHSPRCQGPLVPVDCTAIPPGLFASQLFGHVKGAFSGADCDTLGAFRAADGGTIFFDEIGELPLELQAQLLRVIQQRAVIPVGGCREIPVSVRVVAATNRCLSDEVAAGRFRLDLYYRLNVVRVETVPLAQRPEDIAPLGRHILAKLAVEHGLPQKRLSLAAINRLALYSWPGNVRQLQNILERVVIFSPDDEISERQLLEQIEPELLAAEKSRCLTPEHIGDQPVEIDPVGAWPTLAEWESRLLVETLRRTGNNRRAPARLLAIDRRVLARMIRDYGIPMPAGRSRLSEGT